MKKGLLALDIDGTLTPHKNDIPKNVINYLKNLHLEGWQLLIITGRSYPFALDTVKNIDFPYILSTQNGANAWQMPNRKNIFYDYLDLDSIDEMLEITHNDINFFIYGSDFNIFWKKNDLHKNYALKIAKVHNQKLFFLENYKKSDNFKKFPLAKFAGTYDKVNEIKTLIEKKRNFDCSLIKDPFSISKYMLFVTKKGVNKGSVVEKFKLLLKNEIIIAAGNDDNDISMFEKATISIAMEDGSKKAIEKADITAPSAKKFGIIEGLSKAILKLNQKMELFIGFEDLKIDTYIGVYEKEKKQKQKILIDLKVKYENNNLNDDLKNTLDYDSLVDICKKTSKEKIYNLLETLAKDIADKVLKDKNAIKVFIKIKKPAVIKDAKFSFVNLEIEKK